MTPARAICNVGAEETDRPSAAAERAVAPVVELFRDHVERASPVFDWLPRGDMCIAWLNTPEAAEQARAWGLPLFGASPEVTSLCHDKAFSQRVAGELRLEPAPLRGAIEILDPDDLADTSALERRVRRALEREIASHGVTLKPRHGTSGRGRVQVRGEPDLEQLRRALPRLRRAGGAILEPWLERVADLAAFVHVAPDASLTLLGSAELLVSESGVYRGHRGRVDARGRVSSGTRWDEPVREAAAELARAAADRGYTGVCGIDGLVFRSGGREWLRPVVELNARFTTGVLMAACVRERLRSLVADVGLRPDRPVAFRFDLSAPADLPLEHAATSTRAYRLCRPRASGDLAPLLTASATPEGIEVLARAGAAGD